MPCRARLALLVALGALAACGTGTDNTVKPPPNIPMAAAAPRLKADGVSTVKVSVARTDGVAVVLQASAGTFVETNTALVTFDKGQGTAELKSCNSRDDQDCSGSQSVSATSADRGTGEVSIEFVELETCNNKRDDNDDDRIDCADPDCVDQTCTLPAGAVGVGKCSASGSCLCSTGTGEICDNEVDDNCDGRSGCADPTCQGTSTTVAGQACLLAGGNKGKCFGATCKCPGVAEACNNGGDDDCDGLTDCADPDCQPAAGSAGKVCDVRGHTCSRPEAGGSSTCSVCAGGDAETTCDDGKDNDCDGEIDCSDADCGKHTCGKFGLTCNADVKLCECSGNGGTAEVDEATCNDGIDNNCDGKVDCFDTDCLAEGGRTCAANGKRCRAIGACTCGAAAENCSSPEDDDCNGVANCDDVPCQPGATGLGKVCDTSNHTCSQKIGDRSTCTTCSIPVPNAAPTRTGVEVNEGDTGGASFTCGDGKDNDCDGTASEPSTDCQDEQCNGKPVNAFGMVCSFETKSPVCSSGKANERDFCNDGLDNDCDGKVDCTDTDCQPLGVFAGSACCKSTGECGNGFLCTGGTTPVCACSGGGGVAQPNGETACNDGKDNDCDGKADCADSDCQPVGNALGRVCDARGNTCSILVSGVSSCGVCSGNGGPAQAVEANCGDNKDNDCDGLVDCLDPSCDTLACSTEGKRCTASRCECSGPQTESNCGDLVDDDCDGRIDCADPDCQGTGGNLAGACSTTGRFCAANGQCVCKGDGGIPEAAETTCGDGKDNDCDGLVDCADPNCRPGSATDPISTGKICSAVAGGVTVGRRCDFTGQCVCPGGQNTEASCGDAADNDCDGLIDCADSNCLGLTCSTTGKKCTATSGTGCTCPSGKTEEDSCSDNQDDDCDGLVDCADPSCADKACNTLNTEYRCRGTPSTCKDTSAFTLVLTVARARIPADGIATTTITASLKNNGVALAGKVIGFAVTDGDGSMVTPTATTDQNGTAVATFLSGLDGGVSTITATYNPGTAPVIANAVVDQPKLQQIKYITQQYSVMGVRFSSFQETNTITFQAVDVSGTPYPAGLTVSFTHTPAGSSFVGSTPACTTGTPPVCTATGVTDAQGYVRVLLNAGTTQSVVAVSADASAGGLSANAIASNIAIVGAKASGRYISIGCTPYNVPALNNQDCTVSQWGATISCRVAFADRFNNALGVATQVALRSEAGAAGPPVATPNYNPASPGTLLGVATGTVQVGGFSLPRDVDPMPTEFRLEYDSGCGKKVHNPRDGLVTIIASANGEEGFVDGSNGKPANGTYDLGENYIDAGEPFVDSNDNGVRDSNEDYVDANTNNQWDGPNGVWDANTIIWAEARVTYTGYAVSPQWYSGQNPPPFQPAPTFNVISSRTNSPNPATSVNMPIWFADKFFNTLAPATAFVLATSGQVSAAWISNPDSADHQVMNFTQQFCPAQTLSASCTTTCATAPCFRVINIDNFELGSYGSAVIAGGASPGGAQVRASATLQGVGSVAAIDGVSD